MTASASAVALAASAAQEVVSRLAQNSSKQQFSPQALATIMLACCSIPDAPALLEALAKAALPRLAEFNPQDLANCATALANAGLCAPVRGCVFGGHRRVAQPSSFAHELWRAVAFAAARLEGSLGCVSLASLVMAYAKAGQAPRQLFAACAREAELRAQQFSGGHLAGLAWAFAKVSVDAPRLFDAIARAAVRRARELSPVELVRAQRLE